ncbi:putative phage integrase [Selenomonas ruminantium subsp. lactilytica TAM6421]|uniref:Putative phage integrase n=1 Tax=Selenomonas ruminantium subsp. lactilytica (strain NBRC 103574 / TAM6421) TaxID=927704 RepID=I0GU17_SELRL|nr:recombinase family protein [Selenomonas ruminantium]BAL84254.1 putative phage integrase [Selenomonas ruminantium subsp. lactilytica TAM6421]
MKRAALYIRVSTEEQARHGFSLEEQRHTLEEYATKHGYTVVDTYADEGVTARKGLKNRRELQRLLADVRAGLINCILFIKLDRWFRNIRDYYAVQDILDKYHVDWIATQEDYNTTTSNGRLMLNLKLSIAQNESDQIGERIRFIYAGKLRRHEVVAGHLPIGYKIENHKYVIDEPQAAIVRDVFRQYLFYQSISEVQRHINNTYNERLNRNRIAGILKNERYIGVWWGIENYAPAIIDHMTFDNTQKILAIGRRGATPRVAVVPYLFSGLLFCPSCDNRLYGFKAGGIKGNSVKYYSCRKHFNAAYLCNFKYSIPEPTVEAYLVDNIEPRVEKYRQELEVIQASNNKKQDIDKRIAAARARLNRLKDLYVSGFIDRDTYEKDYQTYNNELLRAQKEKRTLDGQRLSPQLTNILAKGFSTLYNELSLEGKKTFWKSIIHKLKITHCKPIYPNRKKSPVTLELQIIFL